jgi:hypothetical protein
MEKLVESAALLVDAGYSKLHFLSRLTGMRWSLLGCRLSGSHSTS